MGWLVYSPLLYFFLIFYNYNLIKTQKLSNPCSITSTYDGQQKTFNTSKNICKDSFFKTLGLLGGSLMTLHNFFFFFVSTFKSIKQLKQYEIKYFKSFLSPCDKQVINRKKL